MADAVKVYKVEIHGARVGGGRNASQIQVWMKVPSLSAYVQRYNGHKDQVGKHMSALAGAGECPIMDQWDAECGNTCGVINTSVGLVRGNLKANKSPDQDYNYYWNIESFPEWDQGDTGNMWDEPTTNTPAPQQTPQTASREPVAARTGPILDEGEKNQLRQAYMANDRTAVIQATTICIGDKDGSNWQDLANEIASYMNQRTYQYFSGLTKPLTVNGAVITNIVPKPTYTDTSVIKNRPDFKEWLERNNLDQKLVREKLKENGFDDSDAYFDMNIDGKPDWKQFADEFVSWLTKA
jgi:hypothetical protein